MEQTQNTEPSPTVIAINGSPRVGWNTHILVEEALKGAASKGAKTEMFNLYELDFKGCISCFECKRKGGSSMGRCAVSDDLRPVLDKIDSCNGLIIGSPIYLFEVTAAVRAFFERLIFQYLTYRSDGSFLFKGKLKSLFIYTMNVPESALAQVGYLEKFKAYQTMLTRLGHSTYMTSTETLATNDYDKYEMSMFNGQERAKRRADIFPLDRKKAFNLGAELLTIE
ncbi:MAG: flavodoxin family protein [Spirochaetaceae bacterium]|nr:flavodoxin family protein [Spirochaetaceae bacterium]